MVELGELITNFGYKLLPYSFIVYFIVRYLEYKWNLFYSGYVKAIWYASYGISVWDGDVRAETIVMLIAFIEAWDHVFKQLERRKIIKIDIKS